MKNTIKRDYGFDNLKLILICLVVLGHVLEIAQKTPLRGFCYQIIYSFHMPVFIFLFGYFARFMRERFLRQMLLPYMAFQLAYWALHWLTTGVFELTFTTPYWILWYLLAMMLYTLVIPVIDLKGRTERVPVVMVCFVLSLISGFDENIGYFMSLARFFSFLPFFVLGYYMGHGARLPKFTQSIPFKAAISLMCVGCVIYLKLNPQITAQMMYGSFSYELAGFDIKIKLIIQIIALIWTALFIFVLKPLLSFKIPVISELGKNTMPIFLLHGFLIKLCSKYEIFKAVPEALWSIVLLVLAIVLLFGNPLVAKAYRLIFGGRVKKQAHTIT